MRKKFIFARVLVGFIATAVTLTSGCGKVSDNKDQFQSSPPIQREYPTVIIDAGHGGEDCGAIGANGVYEKDLNLDIAFELGALLKASNVKIRFTRDKDELLYDKNSDYEGRKKALDMAARVSVINEYQDAIFVSIHMNSFPQSKYHGLQVYYSENSELSKDLADLVQRTTVQNLQTDNTRSIKPSEGNIYLLEKTMYPAVLIECGFISNPEECALLCQATYRKRLALCLYTAIITFLDAQQNNPSVST